MFRLAGFAFAALVTLCPESPGAAHDSRLTTSVSRLASRVPGPASADVQALIAAARGAPPMLCALAAHSVGNGGWGWSDAPVTPLPHADRRSARADSIAPADVQFLLDNLGGGDACVTEIAVRLLASDDSGPAVDGLIRNLASPDSSVRVAVSFGLGLAAPDRADDALLRAVDDRAASVRANVVWALGRIGDGRAVRPATGALRDGSPMVRQAAAGTLGQLDSASAVPALIRVLQGDDVARVRRTAAWALGQLEAKAAAQALAAALRSDADAEVREMSAWALGNIEARPETAALVAAAKGDSDDSVRETAVWALGNGGDESAADALGQILSTDRNPRVRNTAAWALGQFDLRTAPKGLIDALGDGDRGLRTKAAWALGEIGDAAALPAIRAAMNRETDARARKAELRALIRSGGGAAELTELLKSKDAGIREAAVRGLAGQDGMDPWPWPMPRPRPFP